MNHAGFFQRFIAYLVDNIMIAVIGSILGGCCGVLIFSLLGSDEDAVVWLSILLSCGLFFVLTLLQFLYFGYFWSRDGRSLGMRLMNIKVIKTDGSLMTFLIAGLRGSVGYWISSFIFGLGFLWALIDDEKRAWHDMIFNTSVVEE